MKMTSIKIGRTHMIRGIILLLGGGLLIWYALPSWIYHDYNREIQTLTETQIHIHEKINADKMYRSQGKLKFKGRQLFLDRKPIRIISGAVHYFRIFPQYWNDTFMKMKACGLNTVETYVPWNLHEPSPGQMTFYDAHGLLNIKGFIQTAQAHGLYVIVRPGPFICSEWEFGGLPSWLLADPEMKVRSNYKGYLDAAGRYLAALMSHIGSLQYSKGGPIIAFQVENEFGSFSNKNNHLLSIKKMLEENGVLEMLFTSDGINYSGDNGIEFSPFYYEALPAANFGNYKNSGKELFDFIKGLDPDFPLINMEYWDGWFDHWGEKSSPGPTSDELKTSLSQLLETGASINLYMFHGGTNFGFMNGANYFKKTGYQPVVTSYDYIAPLSEAGDITEKYRLIQEVIHQYIPQSRTLKNIIVPQTLQNRSKAAYGVVQTISYLSFEDVLANVAGKKKSQHKRLVLMEHLKLSNLGHGQSYGYIMYRKSVPKMKKVQIHGLVKDRVQVFLNGKEVAVFDRKTTNYVVNFESVRAYMDDEDNVLDFLVENQGRVNYVRVGSDVLDQERKGILGEIMLDDKLEPLQNWTIYSLDFDDRFLNRIWIHENYKPLSKTTDGPGIYKAELVINDVPKETFIYMKGWNKGIVFINNFHLGRYWKIGPQQTLYVPGAILKKGHNAIRIFEQHKAGSNIIFVDKPLTSSVNL